MGALGSGAEPATAQAKPPCSLVVKITKVDPDTTAPVGTNVTLHGWTANVCKDGVLDEAPADHGWSLVKQPTPGLDILTITDPDPESGQPTTTRAEFSPSAAGEYVVRLTGTFGGAPESDEVTLTAVALPPPAAGEFWKSIGPRGGSVAFGGNIYGQVNTLAVAHEDPSEPATLYAGSASGGVWKFDGASWVPLTDNQLRRGTRGTLSIGALALDPGDAQTVYAGTGSARCCGGGLATALGVFRSSDGGGTWEPTGTAPGCDNVDMAGRIVINLAIDPREPSSIWAATDRGLFRTRDRGDCWLRQGKPSLDEPGLPQQTWVSSLALDPRDTQVVYAAFKSNGIYKRQLRGRPAAYGWAKLAGTLPTAGFGDIAVAVSASDPKRVYAGFDATPYTFFRSRDAGDNWSALPSDGIQRCDRQCSHNHVVAVQPTRADTVFLGQVPLFRSTDAGGGWADVSGPATMNPLVKGINIHGDVQALVFDPLDPLILYLADDGGVTKGVVSDGDVITWQPLASGFVIGQFGTVAATRGDARVVAGGAWHNVNFLTRDGGKKWSLFGRGDGFGTAIDAGDPKTVYYHTNAGIGGAISRYRERTPPSDDIVWGTCTGKDWLAPSNVLFTDPFRPGDLFRLDLGGLPSDCTPRPGLDVGAGRLYRARGATEKSIGELVWTLVSGTTGRIFCLPGVLCPRQLSSRNVTAFTIKPPGGVGENPIYYLGTAQGSIWLRDFDGARWEQVRGLNAGRQVNGLAADPNDPNRLYATNTGSSPGRVPRCERAAAGWSCADIDTTFAPGATSPLAFTDIVADPKAPAETVYVATDQGIYRGRRDASGSWAWSQGVGIPNNVAVSDLELQESFAGPTSVTTIRAATWGRGIWELVRGTSSKPVLVGDVMGDCEVVEVDAPDLRDNLLFVRVPYAYRPGRGDVRLRASVVREGRELPFFATTDPALPQPAGTATLLVAYLDPSAPLATESDGLQLQLELNSGDRTVLATGACELEKTWKRLGARTLQVTSQQIGVEGGPRLLFTSIEIATAADRSTAVTPFERVLDRASTVTLTAPAEIEVGGRPLVFDGWDVAGESSTPEREVQLTLNTDLHLIANYRSGVAEEREREQLEVRAAAFEQRLCRQSLSHVVVVTWEATGGVPPQQVTVELAAPGGEVQTVSQLPPSGVRLFRVRAPRGGPALFEVTATDRSRSSASSQVVVMLAPCGSLRPTSTE